MVLLAVTDLAVQRLPDALVLPALVVAMLGTAAAALTGEIDWAQALTAAGCMAGRVALPRSPARSTPPVDSVLRHRSPDRSGLGFGDVKLAGLIGVVLGSQGVVIALAGSFVLPSLCTVPVLLVLQVRAVTARRPFRSVR